MIGGSQTRRPERPSAYQLVVNLKTAKALGVTVPDPMNVCFRASRELGAEGPELGRSAKLAKVCCLSCELRRAWQKKKAGFPAFFRFFGR